MKEKIFNTPWHFMRWLRLGIAVYALVNLFFVEFNIFFLLFGLLFLYQALFDVGCAGGACQAPYTEPKKNETETINYQEIK